MSEQTGSTKKHVLVWLALLVLATASLLLSGVVHGAWGMAVALAIGAAKAGLVAWVFMHLREEGLTMRLSLVTALGFLLLLLGLSLADLATRPPVDLPPAVRR